MKPLKPIFLFLTGSLAFMNSITAQVPEGGSMLNAETGNTWQRIGNCTASNVSVEGQEFTTAIRVTTSDNIVNTWDAQLKFPAVAGVESGDAVLIAFYARTVESQEETGEGFLNVIIEHNVTYNKEISRNISMGGEWKEYYAPVEIQNSLSLSEVSYLFHLGFVNQTVEVADVRWLNYHDSLSLEDLPYTKTTYAGQDPDAPWRTGAAERIEQIRKGPMEVCVVDGQGRPLPGAVLSISMVRHSFGFGTAVVASRITSNGTYREHLVDMFNEAVFENDLKWPSFLNLSARPTIVSALDTLDARHIPVRGHNIIWPAWQHMPDFMGDLADDPERLRLEINSHIDEVTSFTRGRLNDWDVINEPYSEHVIQDRLGDEVMADWFKRARRNDRAVKLYLNDFAIISAGGRSTDKQDSYFDLVNYIDSLGGEVDGIGFQGHFGGELTSIERVYSIVDRFAALGKEIKITEFDIDLNQRDVQAEYTRDFMTILFSHPSVKSILCWGFWAGAHWKPDAAFFDEQWNLRPHGEIWRHMIREEWWTPPVDTVTDTAGKFRFDGFLGTYKYSVSHGDTVRSGIFTLEHSHRDSITGQVILSLDAAIPETVTITPSREGYVCEGEDLVLRAPAIDSVDYSWTRDWEALGVNASSLNVTQPGTYRVSVSRNGQIVLSEPCQVEIRPTPSVSLELENGPEFCPGDSVRIKAIADEIDEYEWYRNDDPYRWGDSLLITGESGEYRVMVDRNGCTSVSNPATASLLSPDDPRCTTSVPKDKYGIRAVPNPCHGTFRLECENGFIIGQPISLFDARGRLIFKMYTSQGATGEDVELPAAGLYLIRVGQGENAGTVRVLSL
jgi:endo-1,4-beta-xylanase